MSDTNNHRQSINQIRRRLFWLLMLAFGVVISFTIILLLGLLALLVSNASSSASPFAPTTLQASFQVYYMAHRSWAGVEALALETDIGSQANFAGEWENVLLLDEADRVLIDRGHTNTDLIGQIYTPDIDQKIYPIHFNGSQVGTLVYVEYVPPRPIIFLAGLLPAGLVIAFFTGALTLIIGLLLMRRVVTPLAGVIATAQAVATGDLSARVQVRGPSDIRSLSDSFNRMAGSLEQNDRERRNMLADIAHELRTPLTILRGRLEGIVDGIYPAEEAQIASALEEVYVLDNLVEDLRLLTLAEARQLSLDCREVNLGEIAERTASLFEAEAVDKGVILTVQIEPDLLDINADPQRIGQVIGNLLSNALRYMPTEGGQVILTVQQTEEGVTLSVNDNGPGISTADLPHLFDRFWRGEKSRTRSSGGAGLGLTIARQLVELHGGTIGVESTPGQGARFWFRLPER
jgi:two-component system OmpR family sensor kinase/two-component system sensor histidine kinase BaeS